MNQDGYNRVFDGCGSKRANEQTKPMRALSKGQQEKEHVDNAIALVEINVGIRNRSEFAFDLGELVRQTDRVHTSNISYLYCLNEIKEKTKQNKMNGNYTGNERSRAAVLGVTDIACARNSHFNIPTALLSTPHPLRPTATPTHVRTQWSRRLIRTPTATLRMQAVRCVGAAAQ